MEYVKLGNTGLDVSRICLGCMGFGDVSTGFHMWVVSDNLLKGAAWNSVQIAEKLHEMNLVKVSR